MIRLKQITQGRGGAGWLLFKGKKDLGFNVTENWTPSAARDGLG